MKKLTLILLLALTVQIYGQEPITYEKVLKAEGVNKSDLFFIISDWFASNYNSAKDVIQLNDKERGVIIGKGTMDYFYGEKRSNNSYNGHLDYTIKIYVKDNRYKVILTSFNHSGKSLSVRLITTDDVCTTKGMYKKYDNNTWKNAKLKAWQFSENLFTLLELKTSAFKFENESDDW